MLRRSVHLYIPDGAMKNIFLKHSTVVKIVLLTIIPTFIVSCLGKQKEVQVDYSGFSEKNLPLIGFNKKDRIQNDTLCYVSIKIPARLDTFYKWEDHSDYTDAKFLKYRFADTQYSQYAESGFFYGVIPDSLYQLTVWHKRYKQVPDSINLKPLRPDQKEDKWLHQVPNLTYGDSIRYIVKDYMGINTRPFIVSAFISKYGHLTNKETLFVTATTHLKDRLLFFIGECGAKDTTGFITNMFKSIYSIRITETQ